jgi:hypothetical protein
LKQAPARGWLMNVAAFAATAVAVTAIAVQFGREGSRRRLGQQGQGEHPTEADPWEERPRSSAPRRREEPPSVRLPPPIRERSEPTVEQQSIRRPSPFRERREAMAEMPSQGDPLDDLLNSYERRKQDETRRLVERAERLEKNRRRGAEVLRRYAVEAARNACARLERAGHRVLHQELLQNYPPSIRIHLWPRRGPFDNDVPERFTMELAWGEPVAGELCVRWWDSEGLGAIVDQGSIPENEVDELWVREQILEFLRAVLG